MSTATHSNSISALSTGAGRFLFRNSRFIKHRACLLAAVVAMLSAAAPAHAANGTWSGATSGSWATLGNWSGGVPGTGNTATFNAASSNTTISLGSGVTVNTLLFTTASAAAYTIGSGAVGSQTLTFNPGGGVTVDPSVIHNELINAAIVIGTANTSDSVTFTNNSPTASLTFAGGISTGATTGAKTLIVGGSGNNTAISGVIGNGSGSVAFIDASSGTVTLTGNNSYTGGTTVDSGTLILNGGAFGSGIVNGTATVYNGGTLTLKGNAGSTIFSTTTSDTINVNGGVLNLSVMNTQDRSSYIGTVNLSSGVSAATVTTSDGSNLRFGSPTGLVSSTGSVTNIWSANIVLVSGGGDTMTFNTASGNTLNVNGVISDYVGLAGTPVIKTGSGTLILSGSNTYSGGTAVVSGTLTEGVAHALPSGTALTIGQQASASNGTFNTGGFAQTISSLTIYAQNPNSTLVNVGTGTLTLNGNISLLDVPSIAGQGYGGTIAAGSGGTLDLGGAVRFITLAGQNNGVTPGDLVINAIVADGGIVFNGNPSVAGGAPTGMTLGASVANTYTMGTIVNAGTVNVAATTTLGAPTGQLSLGTSGSVASTVILNSSQTVGFLSTFGVSPNAAATVNLNGAGVGLTVNQALNSTYAGVLSGSGSFIKTGAGTLTLTGSNSYTGGTTINNGTLQLNVGSSSINHGGANMTVGYNSGDNGSLIITGTLASDYSGGRVTDNIGQIGFNAGSSGTVLIGSGGVWTNNSDLYIGVSGTGTLNLTSGLVFSSTGHIGFSAGSNGTATVSGGGWSGGPLIFVGQSGGTGTLNLTAGVVDVTSGGTISLASGGGNGTLSLGTGGTAGNLNAGTVNGAGGTAVVNFNHTGSYTFSPKLTGNLSVNKLGPGTTILSGSNSYTGATTIASGTLTGGVAHALPSGTALIIGQQASASNGTLNTGGFAQTISSLTIYAQNSAGTLVNVGTGTLTLNGNISLLDVPSIAGQGYGGTIAAGSGGTLNLGGAVRNITLAGQNNGVTPGDLVINAIVANGGINFTGNPSFVGPPTGMTLGASVANTYALGTTVNAGTLNVASTTTLGAATGSLTLTTGTVASTVILNGSETIGSLQTGTLGSGMATVNLNGAGVALTDNQASNTTYAGVLSGSGAFIKSGTGTLTLTGSNSYSGGTTVSSGTLQVASGGSINHSGAGMNVGLNSGDNGSLNITGGRVADSSGIVGYGGGSIGTATITTGTWSNSSNLAVGNFGTGTLNLNGGSVTDSVGIIGNMANSIGTATITSGTWSNSSGLFVGNFATGTLNLSGSGVVSVNGGAGTVTLAAMGGSAGTLNLGTSGTAGTLNAAIVNGGSGTATVNFNHNSSGYTFSQQLTGNLSMNQTGPGTTILAGSNTYTGTTTASAGFFQIDDDSRLGSSALTLHGGGIRFGASFNDLRSIALDAVTGGTVDTNGFNVSYSQHITGGTLIKGGAGTLTLLASNSYGATLISSGTLQVSAGGSINHSGGSMTVGYYGGDNGSLNISGGTVTDQYADVAGGPGSTGTVSITSGTWNNTLNILLGDQGTGTLNVTGGMATVASGTGTVYLGPHGGGNGTLNLGTGSTAGTLSAAAVNGGPGTAVVNFNQTGSYTFAPQLTGNLSVNKLGAGTTTLTATNSYTGLTTVNAGTLAFGVSEKLTGGLNIATSGTAQLTTHSPAGAAGVKVLDTSALAISGSGVLDLTNNAMVVRASGTAQQAANLAAVKAMALSGYNGGTWNGLGITSSTAAADAQVNGVLAVMVYDNTQIGLASFEGVSGLAATGFNQVLLKTTYTGDFDANGTLNSLDYGLEDYYASFNSTLGDLNGDGVVNSLDYGQLDYVSSNQAYGTLSAGSSGGIIPAAVPEPGSIGLMLVGAVGVVLWNRHPRHPRCKN